MATLTTITTPDGTTHTIGGGGGSVTVDSAMSSTSTNPVQNKVIYSALQDKVDSSDLADVATSGDYNDLSNQPAINDGTLTIQKNGSSLGTFTANQSGNSTVNVTVPTATSELTNDSDYVSDANYVHTDSNFTSAEKTKLAGIEAGAESNRTYTAVTGKPAANQAPGFGSTFTISQINQDSTGQITATDRTVRIPNTVATTSMPGLMSASDKSKVENMPSFLFVTQDSTYETIDGQPVRVATFNIAAEYGNLFAYYSYENTSTLGVGSEILVDVISDLDANDDFIYQFIDYTDSYDFTVNAMFVRTA